MCPMTGGDLYNSKIASSVNFSKNDPATLNEFGDTLQQPHQSQQRTPPAGSPPAVSAINKRRENSRYAARDRRSKEADLFAELREVTPVIEEEAASGGGGGTTAHLDRIALLRVACTVCRLRAERTLEYLLPDSLPGSQPDAQYNVESALWTERMLAECLDGFVLIVHADGTILYASEGIALHLGLNQSDFVGCHLAEFLHPQDHAELRSTLQQRSLFSGCCSDRGEQCRVVVRMKTVISQRGRVLNYKSALYRAVLFTCTNWSAGSSTKGKGSQVTLIHASCQPAGQPPLPSMGPSAGSPPSLSISTRDTPCEHSVLGLFTTRHTCDMRFSFASEQFSRLLLGSGTTSSKHSAASSLVGTSFYNLVYPADLPQLLKAMKELFAKGQAQTGFYRVACSGKSSVVWLQSQAITLTHTVKGQKGQYVLAVHHVLGLQDELASWGSLTSGRSAVITIDKEWMSSPPSMTNSQQQQLKHGDATDTSEYAGGHQPIPTCYEFNPLYEPMPNGNTGEKFRTMPDGGYHHAADATASINAWVVGSARTLQPHQRAELQDYQNDKLEPSGGGGADPLSGDYNSDYETILIQWLQSEDPEEQCPDVLLINATANCKQLRNEHQSALSSSRKGSAEREVSNNSTPLPSIKSSPGPTDMPLDSGYGAYPHSALRGRKVSPEMLDLPSRQSRTITACWVVDDDFGDGAATIVQASPKIPSNYPQELSGFNISSHNIPRGEEEEDTQFFRARAQSRATEAVGGQETYAIGRPQRYARDSQQQAIPANAGARQSPTEYPQYSPMEIPQESGDFMGRVGGCNTATIPEVQTVFLDKQDLFSDFQKCQTYAEEHGAELAPFCPEEESFEVMADTLDMDGLFPELSMSKFHPAAKSATQLGAPGTYPSSGLGLTLLLDDEDEDSQRKEFSGDDALKAFYRFADGTSMDGRVVVNDERMRIRDWSEPMEKRTRLC